MSSSQDKASHLMSYVDPARPELAAVRSAERPAQAFVEHLGRRPRPRFRFEFDRKADVLAFLREHYPRWRAFDTSAADRLAGMSIAEAQRPRALHGVAALGQAWWATGDPAYGAAFERFYLAVPTGGMFNWDSFNGTQGAVELDAWFLLLDCPGFSAEGRIAFLDHLHAIADDAWDTHTSRWQDIMLGPEGHNWWLHGMHMLPLVGLLFPEFQRSEFFLRTGWSVVEEHVRGHYKSDGGGRETTVGYQGGSMLNLWDFYLIAQRNGLACSEGFAERLLRATKFLLRLMSPLGGLPSFGDGGHSPGGLTSLAAVAAAATGDGECKWYAERCRRHLGGARGETRGQIPLAAFWEVGLAGAETYAAARQRNPHHVSVLMGPTGYAAMRNSDAPDAHYMAIAAADRGPIVTSHGHNDVFALDVHAGGVRFLGEMGCAPYGESPGRAYDQRTEAHNCLGIAGWEQAPLACEWRWTGLVIPAVRRWIACDTHDFFHGVHEGFYRWPEHQTLHARKVLFVKQDPSYWLVFDWVESNVPNDYIVWFHGCVPGALDDATILLGKAGGPRLAVVPPQGDGLSCTRVSDEGLAAYCKEKGLDPDAYPCYAYRKRSVSECFVWALAPLAPGQPAPEVRRLPVTLAGQDAPAEAATAVEVTLPGHTDRICVSHKSFDAHIGFGPESGWGHLSFRRRDGGGALALSFDHTMPDGAYGR